MCLVLNLNNFFARPYNAFNGKISFVAPNGAVAQKFHFVLILLFLSFLFPGLLLFFFFGETIRLQALQIFIEFD